MMEHNVTATQDNDLSNWLSTYGLVTVEKILERYGVKLSPEDLLRAMHNPECLFFRLIQIPLKNLFNGLILQQSKDYQTYVQKLYIDYLLSGESGQEDSQVGMDLEDTRKRVVNLAEAFHEEELRHEKLIARSQALLIKTTRLFNQQLLASAKRMKQAFSNTGFVVNDEQMFINILHTLLCEYQTDNFLPEKHEAWRRVDRLMGQPFELTLCKSLRQEVERLSKIDEATSTELQNFREEVIELTEKLKIFRKEFSSLITKTNGLLVFVTGYQLDTAQLAVNQEELYFDARIGEKT